MGPHDEGFSSKRQKLISLFTLRLLDGSGDEKKSRGAYGMGYVQND